MIDNVPPRTLQSLIDYRDRKIPTGGFLHSVLTNNLLASVLSADADNAKALPDIVKWCYRNLPADSWLNAENVTNHLNS